MENTEKAETKQKRRGAPEKYLFKPGQSGNLKGRPLGTKNFTTIFQDAIKKIAKSQNIKKCDVEVDLVIKAIAEARGGNYQYYKDIFDRNYGKAKESLDISGGIEDKLKLDDKQFDQLIKLVGRRTKGFDSQKSGN